MSFLKKMLGVRYVRTPLPLKFQSAAVLFVLAVPVGPAPADDGRLHPQRSALEVQLEELVRIARDENANLRALRFATSAARHRVPQRGALPDPMAGIAFVNLPVDSFSLGETPMSGIELRYSQSFPWPGVRSLREEVETHTVSVSELELAEAEQRLEAELKVEWIELYFLDKAMEITRTAKAVLTDMARISEERYAVGKGLQADVTRAQEAVTRVVARLSELKANRDRKAWALASLLGRSDLPESIAGPHSIRLPRPMYPEQLGPEDLLGLARDHRPRLLQLRERIDKEKSSEALARREQRPNLQAGFSYRIREGTAMDPVQGEDWVSASLMVSLPVWARNKQKEKIAETRARTQQFEALYEDMETRVSANIRGLLSEHRGIDEEIEAYRSGLLAQARQTLESSRSAYEVNELEFLSFLMAEMTLLEEEVRYWKLRTRELKIAFLLEAEVGTKLLTFVEEEVKL